MDPKNEMLFSEKQYFRQTWVWIILIALNVFFLFGIYTQLIVGRPFGSKPMSDTGLVVSSALFLLLTVWFYIFHLETIINKDGIFVRFFPFQIKYKSYLWNNISKAEVIQYHPIRDYGGWGIRYWIKGKAYNVSGNKGIKLVFTNGSRLLIGTNKPEEAGFALQQINTFNP